MKYLLALLLFLSVVSEASAEPLARCGGDRRHNYFCSRIYSGYRVLSISAPDNKRSLRFYTCGVNGVPFSPWIKLKRGISRWWGDASCWYAVVRRPR